MQAGDDVRAAIGFGEETALCGKIVIRGAMVSGGDEDFDVGSVATHHLREIQPVFRAWHVNIGEHRLDVGDRAKDRYGFNDIAGFEDLETGLFQGIDDVPADESVG